MSLLDSKKEGTPKPWDKEHIKVSSFTGMIWNSLSTTWICEAGSTEVKMKTAQRPNVCLYVKLFTESWGVSLQVSSIFTGLFAIFKRGNWGPHQRTHPRLCNLPLLTYRGGEPALPPNSSPQPLIRSPWDGSKELSLKALHAEAVGKMPKHRDDVVTWFKNEINHLYV